MAETRERPEWIGGLISFLRGHAHAYSSESKERAQLERYIERLATLSTPREPEVVGKGAVDLAQAALDLARENAVPSDQAYHLLLKTERLSHCPTCTAAAEAPPLAPGEYARIQESLPEGARVVHQKYLDDLTAQIHRLHEELGKERRRNAFSPREILEDAGPYFLGAVLRRWGEVAAAGIVRRGEIGREIGAEIADRLEERP